MTASKWRGRQEELWPRCYRSFCGSFPDTGNQVRYSEFHTPSIDQSSSWWPPANEAIKKNFDRDVIEGVCRSFPDERNQVLNIFIHMGSKLFLMALFANEAMKKNFDPNDIGASVVPSLVRVIK